MPSSSSPTCEQQAGWGGGGHANPVPPPKKKKNNSLTRDLFVRSSASTQEHLKRVYASFALCMLVAALGAYINVVTHLFQVRGG